MGNDGGADAGRNSSDDVDLRGGGLVDHFFSCLLLE
jgi:hypothetical protein